MSTEPRRQSQDLVLTCAEPQYRASPEHTIRSFRPSSVTTTTFVDANVDATAVGLYAIPEDGTLRSQPRQVKSFSSTTATIDSPWATVGAVTAIRAWLPGDVPVRITTADAAAPFDVISSLHAGITNEPDNYWSSKGYYLIGISGANAGTAKAVSTFTAVSGTFAAGATAATAVGDLFVLRKVVRPAADITASVKAKTIQRTIRGTGSQGADMPIVLANDGSLSIDIEQRPIVTAGAASVAASAPIELGDILQDHMTQTLSTGGAISAIDATTITTSNGSFAANGFALLNNGKAVHILSATTATITAYGAGQAGFATVTVGSTAYSSASYIRKTSDFRTRMWDLYRGGKVRQILHGCMPTLNIAIEREQTVKFSFAYTSPEALQYNVDRPVALNAATPITIPDLGVPTDGKGARCVIDGTTVNVMSFNVNVGFKPMSRMSLSGLAQMDGMLMDFEAPSGQFKIYADNDDIAGFRALMDRLQSRIPMNFLYQKGTAPKETWCLAMPTMAWSGGEFGYDTGQGVMTMDFACVSPEAAVDHTNTALYPAATYPGLSELSIGWC